MRSPKSEKKTFPAKFIPQVAKGQIIPDKKRRKRRPKGYQWGIKINTKPKRTSRAPLVPRNFSESSVNEDARAKLKLNAKLTFEVNNLKDKEAFRTCNTITQNKEKARSTSTSKTRPTLFDTLSDTKHVLVASVTVSPTTKPFSKPMSPEKSNLEVAELPRQKSSFLSSKGELKPKRRSAIAGENFVASCLLFSSNSRKQLTGEKKKMRRNSSAIDIQSNARKKKLTKSFSSSLSDSKMTITPEQQEKSSLINTMSSNDPQVAFARPWISSLAPGSSKPSNLSSSPFKLANHNHPTFKMMSAAQSPKKLDSIMPPKLNRASMTTYRDMTQFDDDMDEENDVTSTSSSEAESSSSSSAESSCEMSSDDAVETAPSARNSAVLDKSQWREHGKGKKLLKKKKQEKSPNLKKQIVKSPKHDSEQNIVSDLAFNKTEPDVQVSITATIAPKDVKLDAAVPTKRKRGRPRKYPLKPEVHRRLSLPHQAGAVETEPKTLSEGVAQLTDASMPAHKNLQGVSQQPAVSPALFASQEVETNSPQVPSPIYPNPGNPELLQKHVSDVENEKAAVFQPADNSALDANESTRIGTPASLKSPCLSDDSSSDSSSDLDDLVSSVDDKPSKTMSKSSFVSKKDPTLPNWHSENSSLQSSPRAQGDMEFDSRQSSSGFTGVNLDDSFSTIFPTVRPSTPVSQTVSCEKSREKDPLIDPPMVDDPPDEDFSSLVSTILS